MAGGQCAFTSSASALGVRPSIRGLRAVQTRSSGSLRSEWVCGRKIVGGKHKRVDASKRAASQRRRTGRWECIDVGFLGGLRETIELLIATAIVVPIFKRLNLSPVLGFLAAGVALGPHGLRLVTDVEDISQIADIGVLFLLFEMGLELSLDRLKKLSNYAFGLGTLQMICSSAALAGGAIFMGAGISESLVIGGSLSLSSSAFVLKLLDERKEKSTRYATATFGVLLLQDIAVVPLLVLVPLLATTEWSDFQEVEGLFAAIAFTAVKALGAVTAVVLVGGALLRPIFRFVTESNSPEAFTSVVLATVLGAGFVTDELGLSMTLGAFIAGVLLSESSFRAKIMVDIEPFQGLLLGLFFITTGMSMDLTLFITQPLELFALIVSLIAVKASILSLLALPFGLSAAEATKLGLILGQGGEFGFVLFALANKLGFLPDEVNQILIVVIVSSMALTPALAELGSKLAPIIQSNALPSTDPSGLEEVVNPQQFVQNQVVLIVGYGKVGKVVVDMLSRKFIPFIVVDSDRKIVDDAALQGIPCVFADASDPNSIFNSGISSPTAVVLTMNSSKVAVNIINCLKQDYADVPIYVRAHDIQRMKVLSRLGVVATYPETFETSISLGAEVLRGYGIPEQDVISIGSGIRNQRGYVEISQNNESIRKESRKRSRVKVDTENGVPNPEFSNLVVVKSTESKGSSVSQESGTEDKKKDIE